MYYKRKESREERVESSEYMALGGDCHLICDKRKESWSRK